MFRIDWKKIIVLVNTIVCNTNIFCAYNLSLDKDGKFDILIIWSTDHNVVYCTDD